MLNSEQCKNLEKWGMPQKLEAGDWYYERGFWNGKEQWPTRLHDSNRLHPMNEYYLIPSLEKLMEFADKLLSKNFSIYSVVAETLPTKWGYCLYGERVAKLEYSPILAAYELIEKIKNG